MSTETVQQQEEEFSGKLDLAVWRKLFGYARRHGRALGALICLAVVLAALETGLPLITKFIIDDVVANGEGANLPLYVFWFVAMMLTMSASVWGFIRAAGKLSTSVSYDIRQEGFEHLQRLSFSYFDKRPAGWLVARLTSDCDSLSRLVSWGVLDMVWGVCMLVACTTVMLVFSWQLALVLLGMLAPLVWISLAFQRRILAASRAVRRQNSTITAAFSEGIHGVRTTKTLVREDRNLQEFSETTQSMFDNSFRNAVLRSAYFPIAMGMGSFAAACVLWIGGEATLARGIPYGTLFLFLTLAGMIIWPIIEMSRVFADMQNTQASAERIFGLIETEPDVKDTPEALARIAAHATATVQGTVPFSAQGTVPFSADKTPDEDPAPPRKRGLSPSEQSAAASADCENRDSPLFRQSSEKGTVPLAIDGLPDRICRIDFRNVGFAYKEGQPVLREFDLTARTGETIALVGPTGGGKTTIASLLCRFYEPTAGGIFLDDVEYRDRSLAWLQSNLGIVLQEPHLFSGTIRENIRYGRLDATDEQVERAARLVRAHEFIVKLDDGYGTDVGEGGGNLSTGQKQLVSFARAVLADPKIFVMDEATSSVDTETEKLIQDGLHAVLTGRISFIIAHRLSTIRSAEKILVIDAGRTVEQGTHHDLIAAKGRYYQLYTQQFTEEKASAILSHTDP